MGHTPVRSWSGGLLNTLQKMASCSSWVGHTPTLSDPGPLNTLQKMVSCMLIMSRSHRQHCHILVRVPTKHSEKDAHPSSLPPSLVNLTSFLKPPTKTPPTPPQIFFDILAKLIGLYLSIFQCLRPSFPMDPNYMDPNYMDPNYMDPNYMDPNYMHPNYMDPNYMDPNYMDPNYMDPNYMDPNYMDPQLHAPQLHGPQLHGPQLHAPQLHGPQLHGPQLHGPQLHGPQLHGPPTT